jgi:methylenetetrahydrofolate--tRNA-(uracil-5-)-methyltransferase
VELSNAHGLLKAEMRRLGSLVLQAADAARVPGGAALAGPAVFPQARTSIAAHPRIAAARRDRRAAAPPSFH